MRQKGGRMEPQEMQEGAGRHRPQPSWGVAENQPWPGLLYKSLHMELEGFWGKINLVLVAVGFTQPRSLLPTALTCRSSSAGLGNHPWCHMDLEVPIQPPAPLPGVCGPGTRFCPQMPFLASRTRK